MASITTFSTLGTFLKRVQAGNFLEHATVYGNSYGTLKSEVLGKLRHGKDVLLSIDVQARRRFANGRGRSRTEARSPDDFSGAALA
jgi:guanylate kinase